MKCTSPVEILNPKPTGSKYMLVPCGKCPACKQARLNQWVFRLEQEYRVHPFGAFVTLTYNEESLPLLDSDSGELYTLQDAIDKKVCTDLIQVLCKSHLQNFLRKLRKAGFHIKYYAIGEYSPKNRPHYHIVLMSDDLDFNDVDLSDFWPYGFVKVGYVSQASIKYVCKHHLSPKNDGFFVYRNLHSGQTASVSPFCHPMSLVSSSSRVRRFFVKQMELILHCRAITRRK